MIYLFIYLALGVLTYVMIRPRMAGWELGTVDTVILSLFWPFFILMLIDWGFGNFVDKLEDRLLSKS